jgi:hypothetical protein
MTVSVVDITKVFWKFIAAVVRLRYEKLQKTKMFRIIQDCVVHERPFVFMFDGVQFFHNNINTLMYDTFEYIKSKPQYTDETELLRLALQKIEAIVHQHEQIEQMDSMLGTLSIEAQEEQQEKIISELDDIVSGLSGLQVI